MVTIMDNELKAIEIIESWDVSFNLGNVLAFIQKSQWSDNPIEDLEQAKAYIEREIALRNKQISEGRYINRKRK